MQSTTNDSPDPIRRVRELALEAGGLWVVRSASATAYFLDLDRRLLLRAPGPGSSTGPYDGCWVPLAGVSTYRPDGRLIDADATSVPVGCRPTWHLDPARDNLGSPLRWWLQREVTAIEAVPADHRPTGRKPGQPEDHVPYAHPKRPSTPRSTPTRSRPVEPGDFAPCDSRVAPPGSEVTRSERV